MKCIFATLVFLFPVLGYGFDYSSYKEDTLNSIIERSNSILKLHEGDEGVEIINPSVRVSLNEELASMPYECDTGSLLKFMKMIGYQTDNFPPINFCVNVRSKSGVVVTFYLQDSLVKHLNNEVEIGNNINILALWVFSNGFDGLPWFLMNEFNSSSLPNNSSKKDALKRASS